MKTIQKLENRLEKIEEQYAFKFYTRKFDKRGRVTTCYYEDDAYPKEILEGRSSKRSFLGYEVDEKMRRCYLKEKYKWIISILENIYTEEVNQELQRPIRGKCFEVNSETINPDLFKKRRIDINQELTRQIILKALEEVKSNPKYAKKFWTVVPKKRNFNGFLNCKDKELNEKMDKKGYHWADRVHQALEWAQRINNGESWRAICNNPDTISVFRLVKWWDNTLRLVGGCDKPYCTNPPADYSRRPTLRGNYLGIPLVVVYEKTDDVRIEWIEF